MDRIESIDDIDPQVWRQLPSVIKTEVCVFSLFVYLCLLCNCELWAANHIRTERIHKPQRTKVHTPLDTLTCSHTHTAPCSFTHTHTDVQVHAHISLNSCISFTDGPHTHILTSLEYSLTQFIEEFKKRKRLQQRVEVENLLTKFDYSVNESGEGGKNISLV